MVWWQ